MANNGVGSRSKLPSQRVPGKHGRPTVYTDMIAEEICNRLTSGESLEAMCADPHLPSATCVLNWVFDGKPEHERFVVAYARAREKQAERYADQIIPIADSMQGKERHEVYAADLRIKTRQWLMARRLRAVYGDKVEHQHTGNVKVAINLGGKPGDDAKVINGEESSPKLPKPKP